MLKENINKTNASIQGLHQKIIPATKALFNQDFFSKKYF